MKYCISPAGGCRPQRIQLYLCYFFFFGAAFFAAGFFFVANLITSFPLRALGRTLQFTVTYFFFFGAAFFAGAFLVAMRSHLLSRLALLRPPHDALQQRQLGISSPRQLRRLLDESLSVLDRAFHLVSGYWLAGIL